LSQPRLAVCDAAVLIPSVEHGAGTGGSAVGDDDGGYHLHHWWLAWLVSLVFAFNHVFSAVPLAVASAAFTQGCAAYNVAPLISDSQCYWWASCLLFVL
jgi:hypothetical protein